MRLLLPGLQLACLPGLRTGVGEAGLVWSSVDQTCGENGEKGGGNPRELLTEIFCINTSIRDCQEEMRCPQMFYAFLQTY